MIDLLYIAGTVAFFALAIGYIAFCEKLGGASAEGGEIMTVDSMIGLACAVLILFYLVYSLIRPEKF